MKSDKKLLLGGVALVLMVSVAIFVIGIANYAPPPRAVEKTPSPVANGNEFNGGTKRMNLADTYYPIQATSTIFEQQNRSNNATSSVSYPANNGAYISSSSADSQFGKDNGAPSFGNNRAQPNSNIDKVIDQNDVFEATISVKNTGGNVVPGASCVLWVDYGVYDKQQTGTRELYKNITDNSGKCFFYNLTTYASYYQVVIFIPNQTEAAGSVNIFNMQPKDSLYRDIVISSNTTLCTDSDNGIDMYKVGVVSRGGFMHYDECKIKNNSVDNTYRYVQSCDQEAGNCYVAEGRCNLATTWDGVAGMEEVIMLCPSGCRDGACIKN